MTTEIENNPMKTVRETLELTQEQMAERLGCSKMTVRRCEYENKLPSNKAVLNNFLALAKKANVSV